MYENEFEQNATNEFFMSNVLYCGNKLHYEVRMRRSMFRHLC